MFGKRFIIRSAARTLQLSKMESFAAIVTAIKTLTIVARFSILEVCGGPSYASENSHVLEHYFENASLTYLFLPTKTCFNSKL